MLQAFEVPVVRFESHNFAALAETAKSGRTAKGEISIVRAHIYHANHSSLMRHQARLEFMLINPEYLPQRMTRVHQNTRATQRAEIHTRYRRPIRKQPF